MAEKTFFLDQGETLGGAERFLLDFLRSLNTTETRRIKPVVVGASSSQYKKLLPEKIEVQPFDFPSVRGNLFEKAGIVFRLVQAAWKLSRLARKEGVKTFFSNTPRTHFVMLLAKKLFFLPGRWITVIHDFTIPSFLLKDIVRASDIVIANSIPTRNHIRSHMAKRHFDNIRIIENGIDCTQIPDPLLPSRIEKVLILGRIDPRKGQKYAVEAAHLLLERNPEIQFFVVGAPFASDPRTVEYNQEIRSFAQNHNLTNVHFLGEVDDPFEAMVGADCVLALPTEAETFGRIVIEGLSVGKLVLAFDETGPREILKNYEGFLGRPKTSLLVETQNPMSLAEKIGYFADHPKQIEFFVKKARPFVEKNFSLAETKKRLLVVLLEEK